MKTIKKLIAAMVLALLAAAPFHSANAWFFGNGWGPWGGGPWGGGPWGGYPYYGGYGGYPYYGGGYPYYGGWGGYPYGGVPYYGYTPYVAQQPAAPAAEE